MLRLGHPITCCTIALLPSRLDTTCYGSKHHCLDCASDLGRFRTADLQPVHMVAKASKKSERPHGSGDRSALMLASLRTDQGLEAATIGSMVLGRNDR